MTTPCNSDAPMIIPSAGVAMTAEAMEEEEGLSLLAHLSLKKAYARERACFVLPLCCYFFAVVADTVVDYIYAKTRH
ncbi:hypothetical protein ACFX1X_000120 [Malus domestica]